MSLKFLISQFRKLDINQYHKLFRYSKFLEQYQGQEWKAYRTYPKLNYHRSLIHLDENFEIRMLEWAPKAKSRIHNHASHGCLLKVLEGELEEHIYNSQLEWLECNTLSRQQVSYLDDTIGYHSIRNNLDIPAVSLHIYSPPGHISEYY